MRQHPFVRPAVLFVFIFLAFVSSGQEARHYTCYRTAQKITADGLLDEPDWSLAEWSDDFTDITGNPGLKPALKTRVKMLWDDENLYVAAELTEPHIWATILKRDEVIFRDNDIELFLDPDGDGLNYYEIEVNALGTVWDLMLTRAYKNGGKPVTSWDLAGLQAGIHISGSLNDPAHPDTSWTVEMALPLAELMKGQNTGYAPADGVQWRVNFSRVEWETEITGGGYKKKTDPATGKNLPEQNWVWSPMGEVAMHIPERWGRLEFSDENIRSGRAVFRDEAQKAGFRIWLWMGGHADWAAGRWDSVLSRLHDEGVTGILTQADTATLRRLIPAARKYGIAVQKWYVALMNNDPELIREHPEWFVVNREGKSSVSNPAYVGYYRFLCPANPGVREYLHDKILEYLAIPGLDGIHLDYIRYPDVILPQALWSAYGIVQDREYAPYDYCYCGLCRAKFLAEYGKDPMLSEHPDTNAEWRLFRYGQVTSLVNELAGDCHRAGKKLSAAVFPGPSLSRELVRQAWDEWTLDEVMPMLYQGFYFGSLDWIRAETEEGVASLPRSVPLCSGLYIPSLSPRELQTAVGKSIRGGAGGISLFNFESMTPAHWQALKAFLGE